MYVAKCIREINLHCWSCEGIKMRKSSALSYILENIDVLFCNMMSDIPCTILIEYCTYYQ